jgi:hypothetical protein
MTLDNQQRESRRQRGIRIGIVLFILLCAITGMIGFVASLRAESYTSRCVSNVHRLMQSMLVYAEDYDSHLPPASQWADSIQSKLPPNANGSSPNSLLQCPVDTKPFGYAFNDAFSGARRADIESPAARIILFETTKNEKNAHDALISRPDPPRHRYPLETPRTIYGYLDGRATAQYRKRQ